MNKKFFIQISEYFNDIENIEILLELISNKLKKFKIGRKKRFYIKYKYPHRRSESHYKSYVTIKRYLTKHKKWYTAKKKCLLFINFEKLYNITELDNFHYLETTYIEE